MCVLSSVQTPWTIAHQAPSPRNFSGKVLNMCVCVCVCVHTQLLSCVLLFVTPWTVACRSTLSMGFSRQEYWSGWPFLLQGILKITRVAIYYNEYVDVHQQCLEFTHKVKCGRENLLWVGVDSAGTETLIAKQ